MSISKQYAYPTNNTSTLGPPKSSAGVRQLPVPQKAPQYINFKNLSSGLLFCAMKPDESGIPAKTPFSYSEICDRWSSFITDALGADTNVTMHILRHNYCTMLFEQGVDLLTVKMLMGHDDIKTMLSIYAHYTESIKNNDLKKAVKIG